MIKGLIVHALVVNRGKILILKRAKEKDPLKDHWDFPGGTLEDGEEPTLGAKREVTEETGLVLKELRLFYCVSNLDDLKNKQFITLIFLGETDVEPKNIRLSEREHSQFRWVKIDELNNFQTVNYVSECASYLKCHGYLIR